MMHFINMDFDGSQWWVEYKENGEYHVVYFATEADAQVFYLSIVNNS